jgi:hypothetical protein
VGSQETAGGVAGTPVLDSGRVEAGVSAIARSGALARA